MDSSEIPLHLKKTFARLQLQMEKAKITGTYIISTDTITYQNNLHSYPVSIENIKRESDANRLHQKMPEFINDLRFVTYDLCDVKIPPGQNWEKKVTHTCRKISTIENNQLSYYYNLGV
ncbi:hypothetical protein C2G38_2031933 [Gigaspora rosea]|uniref:Uncharacterized protein n=1 Tax=Gigaspora rosea TaxID=44941 RepID=A0A397VPF3_9GLOM|nr:hypothetical protein C2G38_2031933 [Gigaspora rosea]